MYKFILMTLCLFNTIVTYASDNSIDLPEASNTQQQDHLLGVNIAIIGTGANCTHQAGPGVIQTAIDEGHDEIRLATGTHIANIDVFDKSVNFKGHYLTCTAATLDIISDNPNHISTISGASGAALPTVRISGDSQRNFVLFKNLHISNGEPTTASIIVGGGIDVRQADVRLTLDTVQVINNQGTIGGGIAVSGSLINVFMVDSLIANNNAQEGGGVYCFGDGATISMRDTGPEKPSGVAANNATNGNGGGLFIWASCDFSSTSGSYGQGSLDFNGILLNSATGHGGGVYVSSGGKITLDGARRCGTFVCSGNNDSNVRVSANTADSDDDNDGSGGGIYANGEQTQVNLINAVIADNTAFDGGGLSVASKAAIYMSSFYTLESVFPPVDKCWSPGSCSQIIGNEAAGLGGGVDIRTGGYMNLNRVIIQHNRANNATALYVHSEPGSSDISVVDLIGSLVTNNGAGGTGGFDDFTTITLTGGQAFIQYTTFADNDVIGSVILSGANGLLNIRSSIIHQLDGVPTYLAFNPDTSSSGNCMMVSSIDDFFLGIFSGSTDDPEFVNRVAGDFHLTDGSPAIDSCLPTPSNGLVDLDEDLRGWDDPAVSNSSGGTFDMGYDENYRYIADLIFKDGFE